MFSSNKNDYERADRFKHITEQEKLKKLIDTIIFITNSSLTDDYFKSSEIVTLHMGIKSYKNKQLADLQVLFHKSIFQQATPTKQYEHVQQTIKMAVVENNNMTNFITAINNKDQQALDKIADHFIKNTEANDYSYSCLYAPLTRDNRLFKKEQALAAAYWWLDMIKYEIPSIIALFNKKPKEAIRFSKAQEQMFVTTLADLLWEQCQNPVLNNKEQSPLYVNYASLPLQTALEKAKIAIKNDGILEWGLTAYIRQDSSVIFKNGATTGRIYDPDNTYQYENFYKVKATHKKIDIHLPEDELIQYRDILSTVQGGKPADAFTHLCSLPKEIQEVILSFAKPKAITNEKEIIIWNTERLKTNSFFKHQSATKTSKDTGTIPQHHKHKLA